MKELFAELTGLLSLETAVFLVSMMPLVELRGAIPIGISLGMTPTQATVLSFIGSMIPVPIIFFSIRPVFGYMRKKPAFRNLVKKLTERSMRRDGKRIKKYGTLGLVVLVAIPLPGTGVWSGSLIASLMNIRFKWAFPAILLGNLLAALQIMTLSNGVVKILG